MPACAGPPPAMAWRCWRYRRGSCATATTTTGLFQGASRDDVRIGTLAKGSSLVVRCFTGHADGTVRPWVLTEKSNWVRASAVKTSQKIPYCSRYS